LQHYEDLEENREIHIELKPRNFYAEQKEDGTQNLPTQKAPRYATNEENSEQLLSDLKKASISPQQRMNAYLQAKQNQEHGDALENVKMGKSAQGFPMQPPKNEDLMAQTGFEEKKYKGMSPPKKLQYKNANAFYK
jgi:hypothetical protein